MRRKMAARAFINLGTFGSFQGHEVPALISIFSFKNSIQAIVVEQEDGNKMLASVIRE